MADEIIDNYRLLKCLMTGQTSQVWEVVEQTSHRHFAMKILLPEKAKDSDLRKLLFHEADVGKELSHPNVIKITAVSSVKDKEHAYYVMEFFPAGSLKHRLQQKHYEFIKERAHSILKQAATALAYMNASGWVHRDVKPDNMLVNSAGELRIIDFALAQRMQADSFFAKVKRKLLGKAAIMGTRSYMSPEQIRGLPLDGRADVYSYGASVYELVAYRQPFRAPTMQQLLEKHIVEKPTPPQQYCPDLTDECNNLILRCLAKRPEDRFQTFHELLKSLNALRVYKSDPARRE
jgi:eukaryotic-like serine/threonine-protein kinase